MHPYQQWEVSYSQKVASYWCRETLLTRLTVADLHYFIFSLHGFDKKSLANAVITLPKY